MGIRNSATAGAGLSRTTGLGANSTHTIAIVGRIVAWTDSSIIGYDSSGQADGVYLSTDNAGTRLYLWNNTGSQINFATSPALGQLVAMWLRNGATFGATAGWAPFPLGAPFTTVGGGQRTYTPASLNILCDSGGFEHNGAANDAAFWDAELTEDELREHFCGARVRPQNLKFRCKLHGVQAIDDLSGNNAPLVAAGALTTEEMPIMIPEPRRRDMRRRLGSVPAGGSGFTFDLSESSLSVTDAMTGVAAYLHNASESSLSASDALVGAWGTTAGLSESSLSASDAMTGVAAYAAALTATFELHETFASLDPIKWYTLDRDGDQANSEAQWFAPEQVSIVSGKLVITAEKRTAHGRNYQSGMVHSRFTFYGGTISARLKSSSARGSWPLLWALGDRALETQKITADNIGQASYWVEGCEEIDYFECGGSDFTQITGVMHTNAGGQEGSGISLGFDASAAFHDYQWIWTPDNSIVFKVDGVTKATITSSNVPNTPMFLLLSVALGGFGGSIVDADYPNTMEVDSIDITGAGLGTADGLITVRGVDFALSESSLSVSDAVAYTFGAAANLSESSLSVSDALEYQSSATTNYDFNLSESALSVSDSLSDVAAYLGDLAESSLSSSDAMAGLFGAVGAMLESALSVADDIVWNFAALGGMTESSMSATDALAGIFATSFGLGEGALSSSDQLGGLFAAGAGLAETVALSEKMKYIASNSPDQAGASRWLLM